MSEKELESSVKQFWRQVKEKTEEGIIITPVQQKSKVVMTNNLPKQCENQVLHAKTKGSNAAYRCSLPDGYAIGDFVDIIRQMLPSYDQQRLISADAEML